MISFKHCDEIALISIDRPNVLNALNREMLLQLDSALSDIENSKARAIIVTGVGEKAFCAGADIAELAGRDAQASREHTLLGQKILTRLENLRQPSIALVHGLALGGGCELALACTFRLATSAARFGLPEVKLGLVPGFGGTQRMARLIGLSRALEIMLTGKFVNAQEAERLGLVNSILNDHEPPLTQATAYAQGFSRWSLEAMRLIRESARRGQDTTLDEGLVLEALYSTLSFQSNDGREGISAFLEKRKAQFTDT
jgi:enoyl-CoA hydratase